MRWLLIIWLALAAANPARAAELAGVNLAGGEFGGPDGRYGYDYIYPNTEEMRAFAAMGMTVFRLPVKWERIQFALGGPLDEAELDRIDAVIATATGLGVSVVLDIHNYGKFRKVTIGQPKTPASSFTTLWVKLAARYKRRPKVIFGLMNEPTGISAAAWAEIVQDTVIELRATGARNLVLVPGVNWSGAHSWRKRIGTESNAEALADLRDPANNFAFDFHQYFDGNSSGQGTACVPIDEAVERVAVATEWLRETGRRGFLSEFGVSDTPHCRNVLREVLRHLEANPQWRGWTLWGSSKWFGNYAFNLYPLLEPRPAQLDVIEPFLAK